MISSRTLNRLRMTGAAVIGTAFFLPLYWFVLGALRPEDEIFKFISPISIWTFVPVHPTLENVIGVWYSPFARAIFNSVLVATMTVILGLAVCSTAAFALAVIEFKGRNLIFSMIVVSFLIPLEAIAMPLYYIMRGFQLQDTYIGLILPGIGNGFAVFLLRQSFLGVPKELREAAQVDGLNWLRIYYQIYLPLSAPSLISASIILFIAQWQAYLWPLLIAPSNNLKVAAVSIAQFATSYHTTFGIIFAGATFISLIPMVVLVVFQRYFTPSVAATGGKE